MTEITLLDGGMGRELERSGAPFRQPEWSALALIEAPETVQRVHEGYIRAGAQVITTNSYALVPFHIGEERFRTDGPRLADLAGRVARAAADTAPGVRVAGSLPPVFGSYQPELFEPVKAQEYLSVLVTGLSPYVDLWLAETQSSLEEARAAAQAVAGTGKPLWISFTLHDEDGAEDREPQLRSGQSVRDAARLAVDLGAETMLFNCSRPEVMGAALDAARAAAPGLRLGVYANAFANSQDEDGAANETVSTIRADLDPPHYCGWAENWTARGASVIGGCCGIGTEHIHHLADHLKHG
ncbi:homocysteine S-methyltransferase family protein [Paenirhodobacter enshiensis]|uniref:Homocysteine methyltransferase n=1 Tax=Paenirhodobacter enshiensis TaxID=1105367 RepID=A0A086Y6B0_9RHOB|nr:homocysteine S-methyltransferase family protein [Paenirhodobacter enshiensis]KFI29810.1 homocysteine methyltransferase [Paenirhodobacter enshiensis]